MSVIGSYLLYYFIVISSSTIAWFSKLIKGKTAKWIFFGAIIIPVIVSGFRYGIGTDYFNYIRTYERFQYQYTGMIDAMLNSRFEPGWVFLNYFVKFIFDDVKFLFIISAFLTWAFSFKAIYDNKDRISVGIAVLILLCTLYNMSFNITRQVLAISIIMLSIKPMLDGKKWKFALTVLFASCFHYISLIFLFSYWIVNSKTKGRGYLKNVFIIVAFTGLVYFFQPLFDIFSTSTEAFETYRNYTIEFSGFSITAILLKIPILLLILLNLKKLKNSNNLMYKLTILYILGIILMLLSSYSPYINRVSFYYDVTQVFILSAIVKSQTKVISYFFVTYAIVIYYIARFTYFYLYMGDAGTMPYNFLP